MSETETNLIDLNTARQKKDVIKQSRQRIASQLKKRGAAYRSDEVCAERIVWAREMLGFSQEDFAEVLNISQEEMQAWEDGTRQPNLEQLHQLEFLTPFKVGWFCSPVEPGWPGVDQTSLRFH